uniref:Uncharacterized protein n=1 Tax=Glossina brevipalpis TaxID=37001 RepID=A0A1A9WAT2_9MUSC
MTLAVNLNSVYGIVSRDLVLTPKQGLQLSGKRIYYEENTNDTAWSASNTSRPWEHALKYATYIILFTNAANSIITGDFSKVKQYVEFIHSSYIPTHERTESRFGDIINLAHGRVEITLNGSFRFIEGDCGKKCVDKNVKAVWQVQKIRHRNMFRNYSYELKFNINPFGGPLFASNSNLYDENENENKRRDIFKKPLTSYSFTQKQDDYPHSFNTFFNVDHTNFMKNSLIDTVRNFRHVNRNDLLHHKSHLPLPQQTYTRTTLHPPPIEHLNTGEYFKGDDDDDVSKVAPKIELIPNEHLQVNGISNKFHIKPMPTINNLAAKMLTPFTLQSQKELTKFNDYSQSSKRFPNKIHPASTIVAHHFHHHFYIPTGDIVGETRRISGPYNFTDLHIHTHNAVDVLKHHIPDITFSSTIKYVNGQTAEPNFKTYQENDLQLLKLLSAQKYAINLGQIEQPEVVRVEPLRLIKDSPLRSNIFEESQQSTTNTPLFIYAAPFDEEKIDRTTSQNKPFIPSGLYHVNQYSELDPLYIDSTTKTDFHIIKSPSYGNERIRSHDAKSKTFDQSEKYQIPAVDTKDDLTHTTDTHMSSRLNNWSHNNINHMQDNDNKLVETQIQQTKAKETERSNSSSLQSVTQISITKLLPKVENATLSVEKTPSSQRQLASISSTHNPEPYVSQSLKNSFSTEVTLRESTRYHSSLIDTTQVITETTQKPILKLMKGEIIPRENVKTQTLSIGTTTEQSIEEIDQSNDFSTNKPIQGDTYEVLTQKSISKTVSIKVGNNGEEIAFIPENNERERNNM